MPEWLKESLDVHQLQLTQVVFRLLLSFFLGFVVSAIAAFSHARPAATRVSFLAMLVMLTVLIAMVTIVIGNSIARAFSLVGALAIVRFRTNIEDTRDTAFVIAAVGVGLAAGAGEGFVPLIGLPFLFVVTWVFRTRGRKAVSLHTLCLNLNPTVDAQSLCGPILSEMCSSWRLEEVDKSGKAKEQELRFAISLKAGVTLSHVVERFSSLPETLRVRFKARRNR